MLPENKHRQIDRRLLSILRACIYASAFIPLVIFSDFLSPFHFGKVILFRTLVEAMIVLYVVLLLGPEGKRYLPYRSQILSGLGVLVAVGSITVITSASSFQSFWGTLERMGGWFTYLHVVVWFWIASGVFESKQWLKLARFSVLACFLSIGYGFLQKTDLGWVVASGGRLRIVGTIGNPALFAGYCLTHLFLALGLVAKATTRQARLWYGAVVVLSTVAIFMTAVRGSLLALLGGVVAVGLFHQARRVRRVVTGLTLAAVLGAILLVALKDTSFVENNRYLSRYADVSLKAQTVQSRFRVWRIGLDGWNDTARSIFVGYGPENFSYPFAYHFNPELYPGSETFFDRAHNSVIEVLVTMGLLGLIAFLFFWGTVVVAVRKFLKKDRAAAAIIIGALVAYFIHNLFIFDTIANYITFFLVLGLLVGELRPETEDRPESLTGFVVSWRTPIVAALGVGAVVLIYTTALTPTLANYHVGKAIAASREQDDKKAVSEFKTGLGYSTSLQYEFRHRLALYTIERANITGVSGTEFIHNALLEAVSQVEMNKKQYPKDFVPPLYLARLYIMLGKDDPASVYNDRALSEAMASLVLAPQYVRTYSEIGQAYLNKKDYVNMEKYFLKAQELSPGPNTTIWYLGMGYVAMGQTARGVQLIYDSGYDFRKDRSQILRMIELQIQLKDFKAVIPLYLRLIELYPTNGQYYASLAVAYAKVGDYEHARSAAQIAVKVDPSLTADAEAFLRSLPNK